MFNAYLAMTLLRVNFRIGFRVGFLHSTAHVQESQNSKVRCAKGEHRIGVWASLAARPNILTILQLKTHALTITKKIVYIKKSEKKKPLTLNAADSSTASSAALMHQKCLRGTDRL